MAIRDKMDLSGAVRKLRKLPKRAYNFKPVAIPEQFKVIIDTREQNELFTGKDYKERLQIEHNMLKHGDYSYVGGKDVIAIERKYKEDLYKYIFDHARTVAKLEAMNHLKFKGLVIEGTENNLYDVKSSFSKYITIEVIRGFLRSVNLKYNMHVYFGSRQAIETWTLDRLVGMHNITMENEHNNCEQLDIFKET